MPDGRYSKTRPPVPPGPRETGDIPADDRPVSPQLLRQHFRDCARKWADQEQRTRALEEAVTEFRMRLENGQHAFDDVRKAIADDRRENTTRIAELQTKLQPKPPPSPIKVAGFVLTVVLAGACALWGLSQYLHDRPTTEQLDKVMDRHDKSGHAVIREEVERIQIRQEEQTKKLDQILERVDSAPPAEDPIRRRRR